MALYHCERVSKVGFLVVQVCGVSMMEGEAVFKLGTCPVTGRSMMSPASGRGDVLVVHTVSFAAWLVGANVTGVIQGRGINHAHFPSQQTRAVTLPWRYR